jgi:hypothetical protein
MHPCAAEGKALVATEVAWLDNRDRVEVGTAQLWCFHDRERTANS